MSGHSSVIIEKRMVSLAVLLGWCVTSSMTVKQRSNAILKGSITNRDHHSCWSLEWLMHHCKSNWSGWKMPMSSLALVSSSGVCLSPISMPFMKQIICMAIESFPLINLLVGPGAHGFHEVMVLSITEGNGKHLVPQHLVWWWGIPLVGQNIVKGSGCVENALPTLKHDKFPIGCQHATVRIVTWYWRKRQHSSWSAGAACPWNHAGRNFNDRFVAHVVFYYSQ